MENSSHYSSFSTQQQRFPQDVESQYFRSDPDEIEDGMPPELTDAYPINATSDRLFTNVPIDDPDEYIEQEHNPIWQVRGSHVLSFNEQHERNRRIAAQLRDSGSPNLRTVQLFNGNLVLDCPVAPRLLREIPHAQSPERDEFSHMRYSSVTCDPSDFRERNYTLRPLLFAKPRRTELLVAVTMYNEDAVLLGRTIKAVMSNLKHLCSQKSSTVWGKEAWKKVVICIISDGRSRINRSCLALLTGLGVYQDGIAIQRFQDLDVVAHLYEYTTQVRIEIANDQVKLTPRGVLPCQILFCLKEKNQRKVNSHRWLFQAFGDILNPNICIMLDAGTVPVKHAFYYLWDTLRRDPACGCAIGEYKTRSRSSLLNPLVAMQHFEYKMKSILDRPLESLFGHRFDMSGALSAYRYIALLNDRQGNGPLQRYFLQERTVGNARDIMQKNMALAEERVLSFELVTKKNCSWKLLYVASAFAEVDVPTALGEFLAQRRRWLAGNTYASLYALANLWRLLGTAHSILRKVALTAQFAYQAVDMCLSWFSLGLFFLTFHITTTSLSNEALYGRTGDIFARFFGVLYLLNLFFGFILALGNWPDQTRKLYMTITYIWTLIMIYMIFALIALIFKISKTKDEFGPATVLKLFQTQLFWSLVIPLLVTYGIWLIVSVLFLSPWHMITSFIQYILFLPTSVNLVSVYAFCNIHDVSWGTKSGVPALPLIRNVSQLASGAVRMHNTETDLDENYDAMLAELSRPKTLYKFSRGDDPAGYYKGMRTMVVFSWLLSNAILTATILNVPSMKEIKWGPALQVTQGSVVIIAIVFWRIAGDALLKFAGVVTYLIVNTCRRTIPP